MSELKPCPFCGKQPKVLKRPDSLDGYFCAIACYCGKNAARAYQFATDKTSVDIAYEKAAQSWNRRAEPENNPLTLEELWQYAVEHKAIYVAHCDNTPVLDGLPYCAAIVDRFAGYGTMGQHVQAIYGRGITLAEDDYGKTWLAYRQKPVSK